MEIKNICKLEYSEVCSKTIEQFDRTEMVLNLFHSFVSSVLIHKTNSSTLKKKLCMLSVHNSCQM